MAGALALQAMKSGGGQSTVFFFQSDTDIQIGTHIHLVGNIGMMCDFIYIYILIWCSCFFYRMIWKISWVLIDVSWEFLFDGNMYLL